MAKFKIKQGDMVQVIAGKDKGRTGKVLRVHRADGRVLVEGLNMVKRHQKPSGEQPGQIIEKEAALHVSNVALWNAEESRRMKVAYQVVEGKKLRVDRKTGNPIDTDLRSTQ
jgi:large subunit ribosomal protein L24